MRYETEQERAEHEAMVEAALKADREAALRDVFATAAIGAMIAAGRDDWDKRLTARRAYEWADAMLEARKQ